MRRNVAVFCLLLSTFLTLEGAWAQSANRAKFASLKTQQNRVTVDAAPLLASGVGLSYNRSLTEKLIVGPRVDIFNLKSQESTVIEHKHKILRYGIETRYFLTSSAASNMYLLGAIINTQAETEATIKIFKSNTASESTSKIGGIVRAGYQAIAQGLGENFVINVGGVYGTGYGIAATSDYVGGKNIVRDIEIRNSIYLEASLSMLF